MDARMKQALWDSRSATLSFSGTDEDERSKKLATLDEIGSYLFESPSKLS
jgi:hypothetical protein